ncbi:MAG TPA: hypothetical protein ENN76_01505 [Euryarchaeota archaeon]|nr:hypothetical protein [Euryarchaeota archaeon]
MNVVAPFTCEDIYETSNNTIGKEEIRSSLSKLGIPVSQMGGKKAMQFGSGSTKLLQGLARSSGMTEKDFVLHYMEDIKEV